MTVSSSSRQSEVNPRHSRLPIYYSTLEVEPPAVQTTLYPRLSRKIMRSSRLVIFSSVFVTIAVVVTVTLVITLSPNSGGPRNYEEYLLTHVNKGKIKQYIDELPSSSVTGSKNDDVTAKYIHDSWIAQGLSDVQYMNYTVLLSRAPATDNKIYLLTDAGDVFFETNPKAPNLIPDLPDEEFLKVPPAYSAFSGHGVVMGDLVYVNYGRLQDFTKVQELGVEVSGNIIIARYSQSVFPGDVVRLAEARNVIGVIFYSDPEEVVISEYIFPDGLSATGRTYRLETLRAQGDLLTPGRPATDDALKLSYDEADLPKIPVQPIGYDDAKTLFSNMGGSVAPDDFIGGLNLTYYLGSAMLKGAKVKMEVARNLTTEKVTCVMGTLRGGIEPDRYVVIGGHHDSWGLGGTDSSTATLLETSRVIKSMINEYTIKPRRTLLFISWGGSVQGLIGSNEFVEQFEAMLQGRGVVYINNHVVMEGTKYLKTHTHPLLYKALEYVTREIRNPNNEEFIIHNRPTVYDSWLHYTPSTDFASQQRPLHHGIDASSDCASFIFKSGIPCLDFKFTDDKPMPLQHTPYDSKYVISKFLDPELSYHVANVRIMLLLAWLFSQNETLQYSLYDYSQVINSQYSSFNSSRYSTLQDMGVSLESLHHSVNIFSKAAVDFRNKKNEKHKTSSNCDADASVFSRILNDAAMLSLKTILSPNGLPDRPYIKYIVDGPSYTNSYSSEGFPGLEYLISKHESGSDVKAELLDHIDSLNIALRGAAEVLNIALLSNLCVVH